MGATDGQPGTAGCRRGRQQPELRRLSGSGPRRRSPTGSSPGRRPARRLRRLVPGSVPRSALVPGRRRPRDWRDACGKTQLAVAAARFAVAGRRGRAGDLADRHQPGVGALRLRGGGRRAGVITVGDPESVAARFIAWLRDTPRPWLVVFDDLAAAVALDKRLWPGGPIGRVLITTADPATLAGRPARRRPRRPVQPPGGAELPARPAHRRPRPAAGRHRPGRRARQ